MEITKDTKLADLIAQYPWLKAEMAKVNEKFKVLNTPVDKIMLGKATITEMSKKSLPHGLPLSYPTCLPSPLVPCAMWSSRN